MTGAGSGARNELVCLGLATLDTIVALPHWPEPDSRTVVRDLLRAGGGPAATAAVAAARLGRSVAFVGRTGQDAPAVLIRRGLMEAGVNVETLGERPGRSSESVILVETASSSRTILHAPGVAVDDDLADLAAGARRLGGSADWVHVDHVGWRAALAADLPRERLSVDAGNPIAELELEGLGLYAPPASALAARYPGLSVESAVRHALSEGARLVAVTLAGGGALAASTEGAWRVTGVVQGDIVSSLGAGDVFHGALLAGLLEQRGLADALRRANLAAALSCRALDGRSAIPTRHELEQALPASPAAEAISLEDAA